MRNKAIRKVFIVMVCLMSLFLGGNVFADGGFLWVGSSTGGGGTGSGGYGNDDCNAYPLYMYAVDCTGISWAYYKAEEATPQPTTVPSASIKGAVTKVIIPPQCSENDGGFWHLGNNSRGGYLENVDGIYKIRADSVPPPTVPDGYSGHWTTVTTDYFYYPGSLNKNEKKLSKEYNWPAQKVGVYKLDHYGTVQNVLDAYNEAMDSIGRDHVDHLPGGIYGFCYYPGMGNVGEYYAQSNVSSGISWTPTGFVSDSDAENGPVTRTVSRVVTVGSTVEMRFSHNIYASIEDDRSTNWSISKTGDWNKSGVYSVVRTNTPAEKHQGSTTITSKLPNMDRYQPTESNRPFLDGSNRYLSRDVYEVTFSQAGTYEFCESLSISNNVVNRTMTKVCVQYEAEPDPCTNWIPESYYEGVTSTKSLVKFHDKSEADANYQETLWAKPTDLVDWKHCYYPGIQKLYNSVSTSGWGNSFSVKSTNLRDPEAIGNDWTKVGNYQLGAVDLIPKYNGASYAIGDADIKYLYDKGTLYEGITVRTDNVGTSRRMVEKSTTSTPIMVGYDLSIQSDSEAVVNVPYNFINRISVDGNKLEGKIYAGETAKISGVTVEVQSKKNELTKGTYATRVDDAKVRAVSFVADSAINFDGGETDNSGTVEAICTRLESLGARKCNSDAYSREDLDLNTEGNLILGSAERSKAFSTQLEGVSLKVDDETAGTTYCVVAAIYPSTSGGWYNMDVNGNYRWYISKPACAKIAKKPSLQVWGNGLFTAGKVSTAVAEKSNLGGEDVVVDGQKRTVVFGSWVETNIVANGGVEGLSSGAAIGFNGDTSRTFNGNGGSLDPAGSHFSDVRSPLTMPNSATTSLAPGIGGVGSRVYKPLDKDALVDKFTNPDDSFKYMKVTSATYSTQQFLKEYNGGSNFIASGDTWVIDARDRTLTIEDNIYYENYVNSLEDVPKLIIRAGDINISCGVEEIHAVLIADRVSNNRVVGKINTCVDQSGNTPDINDSARSNQLKIYGAVIAGTLEANRTYGAGTGEYSVLPAEIIDYDTSLYLWGAPKADASASGKLETTYIRELPPRY